ncbi:MAG: hypothetical protein EWM72_00693 [Nitrospira sp.]|nr:MAG: hypothetical protein EWM72_00693 [Nitrospira sp.]
MRTRWSGRWLSAALLATTISCASGPPQDLILQDDHAGLTRWYAREAASLRDKAEEMRRMAEEYAKPDYLTSPKQTKEELIAHCQLFIKLYTEGAREAEALAKLHHGLDKTIE